MASSASFWYNDIRRLKNRAFRRFAPEILRLFKRRVCQQNFERVDMKKDNSDDPNDMKTQSDDWKRDVELIADDMTAIYYNLQYPRYENCLRDIEKIIPESQGGLLRDFDFTRKITVSRY